MAKLENLITEVEFLLLGKNPYEFPGTREFLAFLLKKKAKQELKNAFAEKTQIDSLVLELAILRKVCEPINWDIHNGSTISDLQLSKSRLERIAGKLGMPLADDDLLIDIARRIRMSPKREA